MLLEATHWSPSHPGLRLKTVCKKLTLALQNHISKRWTELEKIHTIDKSQDGVQINIKLMQTRNPLSIMKRRYRAIELNKPQKSVPAMWFLPLRLSAEQPASCNVLQDKAASHTAGREQSASFYLPLFSVNIAALFSPGSTFHLCFRDVGEHPSAFCTQEPEICSPPLHNTCTCKHFPVISARHSVTPHPRSAHSRFWAAEGS